MWRDEDTSRSFKTVKTANYISETESDKVHVIIIHTNVHPLYQDYDYFVLYWMFLEFGKCSIKFHKLKTLIFLVRRVVPIWLCARVLVHVCIRGVSLLQLDFVRIFEEHQKHIAEVLRM